MRITSLVCLIVVFASSLTLAQGDPNARPPVIVRPLPNPNQPIEPLPDGKDDLGKPKPLTEGQRQAVVASAPLVMVAIVTEAERAQIQAMIWPPRIGITFCFREPQMLRGAAPAAAEKFQYMLVGEGAVAPAPGDKVLVAAEQMPEHGWTIKLIELADDAGIKRVKQWISVPLGWSVQDGKPVSPWASLKDYAWPKDAVLKADVVCSKTGRPALGAAGAKITVEQVLPEDVKKFDNPFGDGIFKVTVTNPTDKPLLVPALLADDKQILWADSLVFVVEDKSFTLPPSDKLDAAVRSVTLKPGESVEANINTLSLSGVSWARGGSRIYFTFCLGDASQQNFFYYSSRHHDPMLPGRAKPGK